MDYPEVFVRALVQPLLMHLKAKNLPVECVFTLHRFAVGEAIPLDDLHMALWGIETAAYFASDQSMSAVAREAASYCLQMCSAGYQERLQQVFKSLTRDMNNIVTRATPRG